MKRKIKHLHIALGLVFVWYLLLICQNRLICDDLWYSYSHVTGLTIHSVKEAFISQQYDYLYHNGRFLIHWLTQCFAGMKDGALPYIRVFNSVAFTSLVYVMYQMLRMRTDCCSAFSVLILGLLLGIPAAGYSFLGNIAFSINYVWTSAAVFSFIYLLLQRPKIDNRITKANFVFFAFVSGSLQESFSIGVSAGLIMFWLFNRKNLMRFEIVLIAAFLVGTILLVIAPGNYVRLKSEPQVSASIWYRFVSGCGSILVYAKTFSLLIVCLIIWSIRKASNAFEFIRDNILLLITAVVNALFVIIVAITGPHQLVCVELCSLIVLLRLFYIWIDHHNVRLSLRMWIRRGCIFVSLLLFFPIYYYRGLVSEAYDSMINSARESYDGVMIGGDYDRYSFSSRNWFIRNYTTTEYNQRTDLHRLSLWLTDGSDPRRISCRLPLPKEDIVSLCREQNVVSSNVFHVEKSFFYVIRQSVDDKNSECVICSNQNPLSRIRSVLTGTSTSSVGKRQLLSDFSCLEKGEYRYYIVYDNDQCPIQSICL